ncbi:MAG: HAMP domain-containing protein [Chloroflexaceae bacterium]|nr:HAMP domain-containing protein [Chloroflexaceae bacterium]
MGEAGKECRPIIDERLEELGLTRRIVIADTEYRVVYDSDEMQAFGSQLPARLRAQAVPIMPAVQNGPLRPNRFRQPSGLIGYVIVPVGLQYVTVAEQGFFASLLRISLLGSAVAGGVALFTALLVSRQVTAPLRSLTQAVRRLAAGEQHEPLPLPADAELAELAQSFNLMAAELERQETLRRQLVADIAHELRTPLTVLRLQLESIEDGIEQPTPATLGSLSHEVGLLTRLVNDLRLLSLAEAGQLSLNIQPLDAAELVGHIVGSAGPRARQQQIALHLNQPNEAIPPVLADEQRLAQVLGNLIENALRYTPPGGQVWLGVSTREHAPPATPTNGTTRLWRIGSRATRRLPPTGALTPIAPNGAGWLVFEVGDTGPGIAPEDLPYIFERFYRTDRARTREKGGSGLGLAIVQRLVEAQGGQVHVSSIPGRGTTFYVQLPVASGVVVGTA